MRSPLDRTIGESVSLIFGDLSSLSITSGFIYGLAYDA
jgi:hypothetical protein